MCLFCDIIEGNLPSERIYEDENVYAFKDIDPQADVHALIVPKKHYESLTTMTQKEIQLIIPQMFAAALNIAETKGIKEDGFRTVFNCNKHGGQTVFHLHLHLLGGQQLSGDMTGLNT
jgi:histidine triad (HIT) family protein